MISRPGCLPRSYRPVSFCGCGKLSDQLAIVFVQAAFGPILAPVNREIRGREDLRLFPPIDSARGDVVARRNAGLGEVLAGRC